MTPLARKTVFAALPVVLVVAYVTVPGLADGGGAILNAYNLCAVVSASVLIVAVALGRPRPLLPWLLIAGAVLLWVIGDVVYDWVGGDPIVSFADAFYVPAYIALIVACLRFLRLRIGQRDSDSLLDAAMVSIASALALWELVVEPTWNAAGTSPAEQMMGALYPLLDVILLCMLVQLLLVPGRRLVSLILLLAGMGWILLADTIYAVLVQTSSYGGNAERLLNATWLLGYALFPIAALHPSMTEMTRYEAPADDGLRRGRLFIPGLALLTVPMAVLVASILGRDPGIATTTLAAVTVVPLVLWRIVRLNRSTERARDAIARQERYYRALATNSSDAFLVVDRDARVLDASSCALPAHRLLAGRGRRRGQHVDRVRGGPRAGRRAVPRLDKQAWPDGDRRGPDPDRKRLDPLGRAALHQPSG